jgi:hypothetical protein
MTWHAQQAYTRAYARLLGGVSCGTSMRTDFGQSEGHRHPSERVGAWLRAGSTSLDASDSRLTLD